MRIFRVLLAVLIVVVMILPLVLIDSVLAAAPTVTSCTPPTGNRGESSKSVVIAGTNFTGSTRVNFGSEDWAFGTAGEYTYDAGKIVVSGGSAALVAPCYSHWMYNESSGTNASDASGNGRNGTIVGSPQYWVPGKLNNCVRLAGQYVDFGAIADWERTNVFSAECWFKVSTITGNAMLFGKELWSGTYRGWSTYLDASGMVYFLLCSDFGTLNYLQVRTTATGFNNGAWHHAVWTYTGSSLASGVIIYVDGVARAVSVLQNTLSATIKTSATMQMGAASASVMWPGDIDESVLYTSVLSASDVTARYNGGAGTQTIIGSYDTSDPPIVGNNTLSFAQNLTSFVATATTPSGTEIRYQVSVNNGSTYRYWNGAIWTTSDLTYAQSSTASDINVNISTLGSSGTFKVRAMLHSTGANTPTLDNIAVGSGITVNSFIVDTSTQITANITIPWDCPLGARDVIVKNVDGEGVGSSKFTINAPLPTVTGINPTFRTQGETGVSEVITGTGFIDASVVAFSGTGVTVNSFVVNLGTQITANITVAGGAPTGFRDVLVTTPGGTGTGTGLFEVRSLGPIVSSLAPDNGNRGESGKTEVITGQYFTGATVVTFSGTGITVNSFVVDLDTQITANVDISWSATLGLRDVSVTTGIGTGIGYNKYTVNAPVPTVTVVNPSSGNRGETGKTEVITGTGFIGATVVSFGSGITVNSFVVDNSGQITADVTISWSAALGTRDVSVTTPGGTGTMTSGYTVNAPLPTVIGTNPSNGYRGETGKTVLIAGTGFIGATVVTFSGTGITVNSFVVNTSIEISVNIDIGLGAAMGVCDVAVTTPGGTGTGVGVFTVTAAVTSVSTVTPSSGQKGNHYSVIITGAGFTGATVVSFGAGVTVNSYTVDTDARITSDITVEASATLGSRTVSVVGLGNTGTKTDGFSVTSTDVSFILQNFALLFFCLALSGGLTVFSWKGKFMPLSMAASASWFVLMIIVLINPEILGLNAGLSTGWVIMLVLVLVVMIFIPLLFQMRTDIKHEVSVRGNKVSWTEGGRPPSDKRTSREERDERQKAYKKSFRDKIRGKE